MSKLVWDQTGDRLYEMGTKNGVLFKQKSDGTYENGVAWNGLTGFTESPDGAENNKIYADDIEYGSYRTKETYGGTISAYTYPPEWSECDGSATIAAGVFLGLQKRQAFGFCCKTQIGSDTVAAGDGGYKLHIVYNATVSPSERAYETINDSPDAIEFSWDFETTPIVVDGYKESSYMTIDSTKADGTKLATLEAMLFGSDDSESTLPSIAEIIALFKDDSSDNTEAA